MKQNAPTFFGAFIIFELAFENITRKDLDYIFILIPCNDMRALIKFK